MKTSLFLCTALAGVLVTGMASAATKNFKVAADGENELPAPGTAATFNADAVLTLDTTAHTLCGKITLGPASTVTTTTAKVINVHIHKGDDTIPMGEVIIPILPPLQADVNVINVNIKGIPADDSDTVDQSDTYLNIHTTDFADGAIRGQLEAGDTVQECTGDATDLGGGGGGETDGGASSSSSSSSSSSGSTGTGSDAGTSGTTTTPADTTDDGGCNTTGSSSNSMTMAALAGLGLVVAAASRKRKKS